MIKRITKDELHDCLVIITKGYEDIAFRFDRLRNKASKRDIAWSNANLLNEDENFPLVSYDGEMTFENYMKIDNSNLMPDAVAEMIKSHFSL